MKKIFAMLLVASIGLTMFGCSSDKPSDEKVTDDKKTAKTERVVEETTELTQPTQKIYEMGDTVTVNDMFTFTPELIGYGDVLYKDGYDNELKFTPIPDADKSDITYKSGYIVASDEHKYMCFSAVLEYTGDSKTDEKFYINKCTVDYDNGYLFDLDLLHFRASSDLENDNWTSGWVDGSVTFEPLSSKNTRYVRFYIEVADQVETETDKPVLVTLYLNGEEFVYKVR